MLLLNNAIYLVVAVSILSANTILTVLSDHNLTFLGTNAPKRTSV